MDAAAVKGGRKAGGVSRRAEKAARRTIMDAAPRISRYFVSEKGMDAFIPHDANVTENPPKSAQNQWDRRRSSVLTALSSGTHFALSLGMETPREMADRCIVSASTVRDMCGKRSVPNAYSLLLIGEQYPTVLDHWLALIGKRAVDL